jgi:hypothetical protein
MRTIPRIDDVLKSFSKLPQQLDQARRVAAESSAAETRRVSAAAGLERARLQAKYGTDSIQVTTYDSRVSAQTNLIAALDMDAERARLKPPEVDEKAFVLMGRVMDAATKAAAGVNVVATGADRETRGHTFTGTRGEFTLRIPAGESVVIEVRGPKKTVLARSHGTIAAEGGNIVYLEFFLPDKAKKDSKSSGD